MAIAFPPSPTVGDVYSYGGRQWQWNGSGWQVYPTSFTSSLTVGATTITGGASGQIVYDSGGLFNEISAITTNGSSTLNIGSQGTTQGSLVLANTATTFSTTLQSSNSSTAAWTLTFPVAPPAANGYLLSSTTSGVTSWISPPAGGITINTTSITGGTSGRILYDNAGTVGELITGTGVATAVGNNTNTAGGLLVPAAALTANALVIGGGSGTGPSTTTTGTGVLTAVGNNTNTAGGLLVPAAALTANALVIGGGSGTGPSTTTTGTGVITAIGNNTNSANGLAVLGAGGALAIAQGGTNATSFTTNYVTYFNGTSLTGNSGLQYNGTTFSTTSDSVINTLTVGLGGGAISTNTVLGYQAQNAVTTGTLCTAVGYQALKANTSGGGNTAIGYNALNSNTNGNGNVAVGNNALSSNLGGGSNTAVGSGAATSNTSGVNNTGIGGASLYTNQTGSYNTALGVNSLYTANGTSNNTAIGYASLNSLTSGSPNTVVGYNGLYSCQTGTNNVGIGGQVLYSTTGSNNVAIGPNAGYSLTSGSNNVIIGGYTASAAPISGTGSNYVVISDGAGNIGQVIDGSRNVGFGTTSPSTWSAKVAIVNGSGSSICAISGSSDARLYLYNTTTQRGLLYADNTRLQCEAVGNIPLTFWTNFGQRVNIDTTGNLYPNTDNAYTCGANGNRWSAVWAANGTIQTSDVNAKTDIIPSPLGLDFINSLNPVAYKFKVGGNIVETNEEDKENPVITPVPGVRQHFGLIAQEVKECLPEGVDFGGWVQTDLDNPSSEQGLRYDEFISPLIRAIQELSAQVEELKAKVK